MGKRKMDSDLHRIKLETGTVYQTSKGGNYYFRYQVQGERKCVSLKTANQEEAIRKAKELLPTVQATNLEVIATHVKVARKLAAKTRALPVTQIWETYSNHPQRALPATVREQLSYEATLAEFLRFLENKVTHFAQITETHVIKFADYLRTTQISVSTHNRKIVRLRKIFATLQT
jgi:predicted phosphoadenosine phosphosulfate sulfurtransferase